MKARINVSSKKDVSLAYMCVHMCGPLNTDPDRLVLVLTKLHFSSRKLSNNLIVFLLYILE